jgi:hypothetical protein
MNEGVIWMHADDRKLPLKPRLSFNVAVVTLLKIHTSQDTGVKIRASGLDVT